MKEGIGHDSDAQRQEREPGKQKGNEELHEDKEGQNGGGYNGTVMDQSLWEKWVMTVRVVRTPHQR
jgi:hypothetical protein